MPKAKRKGKTFVTEHYVDQSTLDALEYIMKQYIIHKTTKGTDRQKRSALKSFAHVDEISIWVEPRGVFLAFGHTFRNPVRWSTIGISDDVASTAMIGLMKVFEEYGTQCDLSRDFKVILNENTYRKIAQFLAI